MKYLIVLILLFPSIVCAEDFYSYKVGDIVTAYASGPPSSRCIDCSATSRYVVTGIYSVTPLSASFLSLDAFVSTFAAPRKTVVSSTDVIREYGFYGPPPSTFPAENFGYFYVLYSVMSVEKLAADPLSYTINPSLAVASSLQPKGVLVQVVSFFVGSLSSIAFVLAVRKRV